MRPDLLTGDPQLTALQAVRVLAPPVLHDENVVLGVYESEQPKVVAISARAADAVPGEAFTVYAALDDPLPTEPLALAKHVNKKAREAISALRNPYARMVM